MMGGAACDSLCGWEGVVPVPCTSMGRPDPGKAPEAEEGGRGGQGSARSEGDHEWSGGPAASIETVEFPSVEADEGLHVSVVWIVEWVRPFVRSRLDPVLGRATRLMRMLLILCVSQGDPAAVRTMVCSLLLSIRHASLTLRVLVAACSPPPLRQSCAPSTANKPA